MTKSKDVDAVAEKVVKDHGRVDILVNNAGVAKSDVRAEDTSDEHWRFHMDVNVDGVFWCCRAFGRQMLKQGSGSIVNIGSMSGFIVNKPQPQSFYNASKAAVHHLTKSLAAEWGKRGVRVNAVAPTYIETPLTAFGINENPEMYKTWLEMTPMGRVGQPDEIASVVHFLASDAASLLTGSIVVRRRRVYLLVDRRDGVLAVHLLTRCILVMVREDAHPSISSCPDLIRASIP